MPGQARPPHSGDSTLYCVQVGSGRLFTKTCVQHFLLTDYCLIARSVERLIRSNTKQYSSEMNEIFGVVLLSFEEEQVM